MTAPRLPATPAEKPTGTIGRRAMTELNENRPVGRSPHAVLGQHSEGGPPGSKLLALNLLGVPGPCFLAILSLGPGTHFPVADAFEAIASCAPCHPAISRKHARSGLSANSAGQFWPEAIEAFPSPSHKKFEPVLAEIPDKPRWK